MRPLAAALLLAVAAGAALAANARVEPPDWAFGASSIIEPQKTGSQPVAIEGSRHRFSYDQSNDLFYTPDWHPEGHPPAPPIVSVGRKPAVRACGHCHFLNGVGRPENAYLAGMPAAYTIRQMQAFRSGRRGSAELGASTFLSMVEVAKGATAEEVRAAADYYAALKPMPWVKVVEADTVPVARFRNRRLVADLPPRSEAIAGRIIEIAVDDHRSELRDDHAGFIAYVPRGSVGRGKALVRQGTDSITACVACHGEDLGGVEDVPPLAGRSPSYMVRQLVNFQHGLRRGADAELMTAVTEEMTEAQMADIAAYLASLPP